jgi:dihydroflavonol-4-reductase
MAPVAQVIRDVIRGRMPAINPAGINVVDVDDLADGHVLAETKGRIGERYVLGGENIDYPNFLDAIADAAGVPRLAHDTAPPSAFPKEFLFYDSSKARRELGWSSRPLKETIARSVGYLRSKGY